MSLSQQKDNLAKRCFVFHAIVDCFYKEQREKSGFSLGWDTLTLKLPGPYAGMGGSLIVIVA